MTIEPDIRQDDDADADVAQDNPLRADVAKLTAGLREFITAELHYYRSRAQYSAGIIRLAGVYSMVAIAAILGAFIALILGLFLILSGWFGPILGAFLLFLCLLILAAAFALLARQAAKKLIFPGAGVDDDRS